MKQTLFFDLDDTLIHCNKYFHLTIDRFALQVQKWFEAYSLTLQDIIDKQTEIDIAGVQKVGFASDHFPHSFVQTYRYYCNTFKRPARKQEEELLWEIGRSVYELETEPYPHMEETLLQLQQEGHELHLYTGGEPPIQHRKIKRFALDRFFGERIYVRQHKTVAALEQIVSHLAVDRRHVWMIGNSIRTDVVPALTAGMHAIHMKIEREWAFNVVDIQVKPQGAFFTLHHLQDIPETINGYAVRTRDT